MFKNVRLWLKQAPGQTSLREKTQIISGEENILSVAFLIDGEHFVSGGDEGSIRRWRIQDGSEVGTPMETGSRVCDIAVTRDGQWIVSGGTSSLSIWNAERHVGLVTVWNAESHGLVTEFEGHKNWVNAVEVSPDGTKIATGSSDKTACVWSFSTGKRLLGPLEHDDSVVAARFSPDGRLLATATWRRNSVRVYDGRDGTLLVDTPITVNSLLNRSLAWSIDGKHLFALSLDGNINCLDPLHGTTLTKWPIHSSEKASCIALNSTGTLIAASAGSSVSFWDTTTHNQIGSVIQHNNRIGSIAMSEVNDLVVCGEKSIGLAVTCNPLFQASSTASAIRGPCNQVINLRGAADQQVDSLREIIRSLQADLRAQKTDQKEQGRDHDEGAHKVHQHLSDPQYIIDQKQDSVDECIHSLRAVLRARDNCSNDNIAYLEQNIQELHAQLTQSHQKVDLSNTKVACLEHTNQELHTQLALAHREVNLSDSKTAYLEQTIQELRTKLDQSQQKEDLIIRVHKQKPRCESLYNQGRIYEAAQSLLEVADMVNDDVRANPFIADWLDEFSHRCIAALEKVGDEASNTNKQGEAIAAYSIALLLSSLTPKTVLIKWARMMLAGVSASEALNSASKFRVPRFVVYHVLCDILEDSARFTEAVESFQLMQNELAENRSTGDEQAQWESDFRGRCAGKLEKLGDIARDSQKHDEAIERYATALRLDPTNFNDVLLKRSNVIIELDPLSHRGYEGKHAALHGMGHYSTALEAFKMMLSILDQSSDPQLCELRRQYVDATSAIQGVVEETIRDMPRVLIDTETGRLYDKTQQAAAFEELQIYDEMRSSMTTQLDHTRIQTEVKEFYRYVMLSHRWQPHEPTYQTVEHISVYGLSDSPAFSKLKIFCKVVHALHIKWAWSDTCCVNQLDKAVQQESLVAMFRWYRGSSLTVVHLLGVFSESQEMGSLWRSIWNTRGWTYQEYLASEVVQFYTEDWKPYLGLDAFNHKESPAIISEMEQAMDFGSRELATLQPGLSRAREKLFLASKRQTTRQEDMAYSLFGIFNVALPVIYGEGNQAVGRLLEHILTRSDNVTLLAWIGKPGSLHSYLPSDLTVYDNIIPLHVPAPIEAAQINGLVTELQSSLPDISLAVALYERNYNLPPLSLVAGRLRLPGLVFPLDDLVRLPAGRDAASDIPTYRGTSPMLGDVDVQTRDDLSGLIGALLIHPWIGPLLDRDFSGGVPLFDDTTRALRLAVRLKQPFGALLLAPLARAQYRRVATDSLIMVQVREETSLNELMDGIRTVDIQ